MRRLLLAGRTRYTLPLSPALERKFAALEAELDVHVLAAEAGANGGSDARFRLVRRLPVLDGPLFYLRFPFFVARELRRLRPDAVLVQGAQETALALLGRRLAQSRSKVILDLHGDPEAPARLYGSGSRRLLAPAADLLARSAIRHADAVRTLSPFTTGIVRRLGVEPAGEFPAFMDLETFLERPRTPLPDRPCLLFVGVLERYKAIEILADAWRLAAHRIPAASLHLVGRGAMTDVPERLVAEFPGRVRWTPRLSTSEVASAMDEATALLLPSRSEGLPRIVVEAFCRGRAVVGARAGGIPDIVWTTGTASSSPSGTRGRWPTPSCESQPTRSSRRGSVRAPAVTQRSGLPHPRTTPGARESSWSWWRPVRAIFVTQEVDPASPVLGATVAKIRALAARVDEVAVLTDRAVDGALPANCAVHLFRSADARRPRPPLRVGARPRARARPARRVRARAHVPHLRRARSPVARPLGCHVLLWFTHWRASRLLAAAERLVECGRHRRGAHVPAPVAQGRADRARDRPQRVSLRGASRQRLAELLCLGRTSPAKGIETIIRAAAAVPSARLDVVGPSLTDEERRHRAELERLVEELEAADRVRIAGAVPARPCPAVARRGRRARQQHALRRDRQGRLRGGGDLLAGARLEPGARRLPAARLRFDRDDPAGLADRIRAVEAADREALGRELRERVERDHSVEGWARRIVEVAQR